MNRKKNKKIYAIFGGNFNPIHYGHINSAKNIAKEINIKKIIFLPNNNPPHREITKTSIIDKINMIKLGINKNHIFQISTLESSNKKIFYTIDTLKKIRKKIGHIQPLCFIIGEDNLIHFHFWKNWKKILSFTHLLILPRICTKKNNFLKNWINLHITYDINVLYNQPSGLIFFSKIPLINISSSQIRNNYSQGKSSSQLLPENIQKYIDLKKIY